MSEYKIEKNIPIPEKSSYSRRLKYPELFELSCKMDIGDSISLNNGDEAVLCSSYLKWNGKRGLYKKDVQGIYRIWRIK